MKKTFIALVLGALLTIPCALRAEEVENHNPIFGIVLVSTYMDLLNA